MLGIERRQKIMDILQKNKKVYVAKLAQEFGITEETVRRDLEKLENQNLLQMLISSLELSQPTAISRLVMACAILPLAIILTRGCQIRISLLLTILIFLYGCVSKENSYAVELQYRNKLKSCRVAYRIFF